MKYTKAFLTGKSSANTYRNLKEVIIMSSFEKNLSEGNVAKQLVLFSLPFLASNIIQSLYSVADMLIVGRFSGTTSMSGVNLEGYAGDDGNIAYDINHCGSCHYRFNAYSQETDSSSDPDTGGILCRG